MSMELARGKHMPNEGRSCVMELLSKTRLNRWTDRPDDVVDQVVSSAVRAVNDAMPSEGSRWLIVEQYADRIMAAAPPAGMAERRRVEDRMRRFFTDELSRLGQSASYRNAQWASDAVKDRYAVSTISCIMGHVWTAVGPVYGLGYLSRLLDAYESAIRSGN